MSYTRLLWERKCILFYESGKFSMLSQVLPAESVGFLTPGQHISLFPITKLQTIIQMTIAKRKFFAKMRFLSEKQVLHAPQCGFRVRVKVKIVRQGGKKTSVSLKTKNAAREKRKRCAIKTRFSVPRKKHMAYRKKYKAYILKYVPYISK